MSVWVVILIIVVVVLLFGGGGWGYRRRRESSSGSFPGQRAKHTAGVAKGAGLSVHDPGVWPGRGPRGRRLRHNAAQLYRACRHRQNTEPRW